MSASIVLPIDLATDPDVVRSEWPKVRRTILNGKLRRMVDARPSGKREYKKSESEALKIADALAKTKIKQGEVAVSMPPGLRAMALECSERLTRFDKTLRDATEFLIASIEAKKKQDNSQLMRYCLAEWVSSRKQDLEKKRIADPTFKEIEGMASTFSNALGHYHIRTVTCTMIEVFLDGIPHVRTQSGLGGAKGGAGSEAAD